MLVALATLAIPSARAAESGADARQPVWTLVMPFGVPQFFQHKRGAGIGYAAVQAAGTGLAAYSTARMWSLAEAGEVDQELRWRMVSFGAVSVMGAGWFASSTHAAHVYRYQGDELAARARAWEASLQAAPVVAESQD
jgi:hypothetical protein